MAGRLGEQETESCICCVEQEAAGKADVSSTAVREGEDAKAVWAQSMRRFASAERLVSACREAAV